MSTNTISDNGVSVKSNRLGRSFATKGKMLDPVDEDQESEYFRFGEEEDLEEFFKTKPKR